MSTPNFANVPRKDQTLLSLDEVPTLRTKNQLTTNKYQTYSFASGDFTKAIIKSIRNQNTSSFQITIEARQTALKPNRNLNSKIPPFPIKTQNPSRPISDFTRN